MHISQKFGLGTVSHRNMDFIDIDERWDTKLFIDPYVIQASTDSFCVEASKSIDSFFREIFQACQNKNTARLRKLLEHASEPNETNLGMKSKSEYGKGATAEELTKLFLDFYKIVRKNPCVSSNPLALCMYIKNFNKDKMSDLITNIIRNRCYEFTISQSAIWGIPLQTSQNLIGYYWSSTALDWVPLSGHSLSVGHKDILLVPKHVVRQRYVFNVECYIKQYILKTVQQNHVRNNSDLCSTKEYSDGRKVVVPPTIQELYENDVYGTIHKDFAFSYTSENKEDEDFFIRDIHRRINNGYGQISDTQLDDIVYGKCVVSA